MKANRYKTKLFTRGSNSDGNIGLPSEVSESPEFQQVTQIQNHTTEESKRILESIEHIASGRSSIIFSTLNNRIFVCGLNNYNQTGVAETDSIFLFKSIEHLFHDEMERARAKEEVELNHALNMIGNASAETVTFLRERLNKKFERIESIDFVEMGWFHSIVVINKNVVMGSGHSYFGQLYDHRFNELHQYIQVVKYDYAKIIDNIENSGILSDPFQENIITHVSCGTFSTSIVINHTKVYSCGEITPFKKVSSFELDIQEKLENDKILQIYHLDTAIALYTNTNCLVMLEKPDIFTRIENVDKMVGGHLCNDTYYTLIDSPNTLRRFFSNNDEGNQLEHSLSNIPSPFRFYPGYYHIFCISQGKYIFTDSSFVDDTTTDEPEVEELILPPLIGPKSLIGDSGDKLLARLLLQDGYNVRKISSGSDFSLILLYHESSKEQEEMRIKLRNQSSSYNSFIDILVECKDFQIY